MVLSKMKKKYPEFLVPKLVRMGLKPQAAKIYLLLIKNPLLKVREIADCLGVLEPSIHRSLRELKEKNLVYSYGKKPLRLRAIPPSVGLSQLVRQRYEKQIQLAKELSKKLRKYSFGGELKVEFLENRREIFDYDLLQISRLKKEMLILSIGEEIPQKVFVAITRAIQRGISVRMIAERYNRENKELLKNWQKNHWQVRYLPKGEKLDFTLVIYDSRVVILQVRRKSEEEQRIGIAIYNPQYIAAQKEYFNSLWQKAKELNLSP